jgi:hypothetical protein
MFIANYKTFVFKKFFSKPASLTFVSGQNIIYICFSNLRDIN